MRRQVNIALGELNRFTWTGREGFLNSANHTHSVGFGVERKAQIQTRRWEAVQSEYRPKEEQRYMTWQRSRELERVKSARSCPFEKTCLRLWLSSQRFWPECGFAEPKVEHETCTKARLRLI